MERLAWSNGPLSQLPGEATVAAEVPKFRRAEQMLGPGAALLHWQ